MNGALVPLLIIAGVGALAFLMRRMGGSGTPAAEAPPYTAPETETSAVPDPDEDAGFDPATAPVTTEGMALIPSGNQVRLIPSEPDAGEAGEGEMPVRRGRHAHEAPGIVLHAGDFNAARIRRVAGEGWRLETLGRDGEYGWLTFESEATAREALGMFEQTGVLRRPLDDDGQTVPFSPEDFEEARRRFEETESALALDTGDDEPPAPDEWSSRR